jgi:hypothetical protein
MKKMMIFLFLLFYSQLGSAQMRMGVTGYHNIVKLNPHSRELATMDGRHAYTFGHISQQHQYSLGVGFFNNFGNLFLLTEVLYRENNSIYTVQNFMQGERVATEINEKRQVCQIPVSAGIDFGMFRLGAGPTFEFILDETDHIGSISDIVRKERKINFGFQFLGGIDLSKNIIINLKYEKDFNKTGDIYYYNNMNTRIESRVRRISAGVGFYF